MGALSLDLDLDLEASLLAEIYDVRQVSGGIRRLASTLVDGVGRGDLLGVVFRESSDTVPAAVFLVG